MPASRRGFGSTLAALVVLGLVTGCAFAGTDSPTSPSCSADRASAPTATAGATGSEGGDLVIVGRIVTMDEPAVAEALLIEAGLVTCVGTRDEVMALAGEDVPVVDIGSNVAYPGFIDAHAHWIGDRDYYGIDSPEEAMEAALTRGWTSISEQWVNQERLDELEALAADDALPLRVDAYLALNFGGEFFGDWYAIARARPGQRPLPRPGVEDPSRRWRGQRRELGARRPDRDHRPGRRGRLAGLGPRHQLRGAGAGSSTRSRRRSAPPGRIRSTTARARPPGDGRAARSPGRHEHSHRDPPRRRSSTGSWTKATWPGSAPTIPMKRFGWLTRWRDFVDAGLHVASATDAPWTFPDLDLTDDIGRPVDQIAGGMDGRGRASPETPE